MGEEERKEKVVEIEKTGEKVEKSEKSEKSERVPTLPKSVIVQEPFSIVISPPSKFSQTARVGMSFNKGDKIDDAETITECLKQKKAVK